MVAADALVRALELARALNDQGRVAEISALILAHVDAALEEAEPGPGDPLTVLEALSDLPPDQQPEATDEYLNRVKERYVSDPFIVEATTELQAALHRDEPDEQRALHAEAVERFRAEAGQTAGILRLAHLQHALELAREHGLRDELEELRREVQDIHPDELDLKEVSAEVTVPTEQVERLVEVITGGADWSECLARFGIVGGPPSGSHERNLEFVQRLKAQSPLMFLIPRAELGPEGVTVRELRTEEEHLEGALADHERTSIAFWSLVASETLDRILERHGEPTEEELASFLEGESIPPDLAKQLAHAISLFTRGSYDDAAHTLAPRIERAVRELCRRAGLVVVSEPIGGQPGGVRSLGHLLAALQGILDESWRRYLVNALTEPLGMNLRNRVAHGLIGEATRHDAAVLIHVTAFLRTLQVKRPVGTDADGAR